MTATKVKQAYIDTTRLRPVEEARLVRGPYTPRPHCEFNHRLASLMVAISAGRATLITRSSTLTQVGNARSNFAWKTEDNSWDQFTSLNGRYSCGETQPGTTVTDLDTEESWSNIVAHLLTAINYNAFVTARRIDDMAVLSWDRASHGNTPTVVLHPSGLVQHFYNWPEFLPEHLEPKQTPFIESYAPSYYDHAKRRAPQPSGTRHYPGTGPYGVPVLPDCHIRYCPNQAEQNPLDLREAEQEPTCNYHLYGAAGYFQTRLPYQEFQEWQAQTVQGLSALCPLELHAEIQRAQEWVRIDYPGPGMS